jgi:7-cyano-7-deazaguanine synthase
MSSSAVILLSAGLDSTTNLFAARAAGWKISLALTVDYGQRAAPREIEKARQLAANVGAPHRVIELPFFRDFGGSSALVDRSKSVPVDGDVAMDDFATSLKTAKSVWVPNRNGILLNIAAGFAEALECDAVIPGFNAEEGQTFPDNTPEFMDALTGSLKYSTANHVRIECFTQHLDKPGVAKKAKELGVPFDLIWPCYLSGEKACGRCESCQRDKRAYKAAGIDLSRHFEDVTA